MITKKDLRRIALARLRDAKLLFRARRYDGATYLCGYALEIALKARICSTLRWSEFPSTGGEFQGLQSFRTHDLDMLLRLSGRDQRVRTSHTVDWSVVERWSPETRYAPIGTATRSDAAAMIAAVKRLMGAL